MASYSIDMALAGLEDTFDLKINTLDDLSRAVCGPGGPNRIQSPLIGAFKSLKITSLKELRETLETNPSQFLKFRNIGIGKLRKMLALSGSLVRVDRCGRIVVNNKGEEI